MKQTHELDTMNSDRPGHGLSKLHSNGEERDQVELRRLGKVPVLKVSKQSLAMKYKF